MKSFLISTTFSLIAMTVQAKGKIQCTFYTVQADLTYLILIVIKGTVILKR